MNNFETDYAKTVNVFYFLEIKLDFMQYIMVK